jgi:hypothetical protein
MQKAEKIFGRIGRTLAFLAGIALVFIAGKNPMSTGLPWLSGYVMAGMLVIISSWHMSDQGASALGKAGVFFGGIGLFILNAFYGTGPVTSIALVVSGLLMIAIGGAFLKAHAENGLKPSGR